MKIKLLILTAVLLTVVSVILENRPYKITAYCDQGLTKMGTPVRVGVCAVDPDVIGLGSTVKVEGLGAFKAEDTGSKVKGRVIDIYIPDCEKAKEFGVKWKRARVLKMR